MKTHTFGDRLTEMGWNKRSELERMIVHRRMNWDSSVWTYDYDEGGNHISKQVALLPISGIDTTWSLVRKYIYHGVNMVADSGQPVAIVSGAAGGTMFKPYINTPIAGQFVSSTSAVVIDAISQSSTENGMKNAISRYIIQLVP